MEQETNAYVMLCSVNNSIVGKDFGHRIGNRHGTINRSLVAILAGTVQYCLVKTRPHTFLNFQNLSTSFPDGGLFASFSSFRLRNKMDFYGVESTGTTTFITTYEGGVVVAADSRTTAGAYIPSRATDKLDPIHHRIYALRAGTSAHT